MKSFRRILIFVFCILFLGLMFFGVKVHHAFQYQNSKEVLVQIKKGMSVKAISQDLKANQVIENRRVFEFYLRLTGKAGKLKAGEYLFEKDLNMMGVVDAMVTGRVRRLKLTIPEGYNLENICALVVRKNLASLDACYEQTKKTDLLTDPKGIRTLEGYLFPETYFYDAGTTIQSLIEQMVKTFYEKIGENRIQQATDMGLSLNQLITFASIVEKETGLAEERPLVARVIHNRLKRGMLLQMDPTVIYGIKNFDGNLTKAHLLMDSPYNTYVRAGLPVGPICSVGIEAIDAVLHPADSDALYFVAKGDGSHYFSNTLEEHSQAVKLYQLQSYQKNERTP